MKFIQNEADVQYLEFSCKDQISFGTVLVYQ